MEDIALGHQNQAILTFAASVLLSGGGRSKTIGRHRLAMSTEAQDQDG